MQMRPGVTVVIPIYKVEPYLRQCLDSVVNQTYHDLEILLIDDGSPDNCGTICDEYAQNDLRIHVIHKQNAGVSAARNDGIRLATGKWITFLDGDDWWELDFIESMLAESPQKEIDVLCSSGIITEFPSKSEIRYAFSEPFIDIKGEKKSLLIAKVMAPQCGFGKHKKGASIALAWGKLYSTELLQKKVSSFDKRLHPNEDVLFSMQVFEKANGVEVRRCIGCHYRQAVPTASTSRFNPKWPYMFDVAEKYLWDFIDGRPDFDLLLDAFYTREMMSLRYISACYFFHPDNPAPYRQVAREVRAFKKKPHVAAALRRKSNRFLNKKYILVKYAYRLPWVWPAKFMFSVGRMLGQV